MEDRPVIGRVTRCSTRGFAGAYSLQAAVIPAFGTFCFAPYQGGGTALGVIYDINIEDDPLARQLAALGDVPEEQLLDSQVNRQIPIEFSVLTLGHDDGRGARPTLPPRPPLTLESIRLMADDQVAGFTADYRYLHIVAQAAALPVDDLLIASILEASRCRPESERQRYLLGAGRSLARILAMDLQRLERILTTLSPVERPG